MEESEQFGLWPKQVQVLEAVRDSPVTGVEEIYLIGPVGSTKTFAMAVADINVAWQFPFSIIPVGRKDLTEAQVGTWEEYMKALRKLNFVHGRDYTTRQAPNDLRIGFSNGSIIKFISMNKSRDPDWAKLKITATKATVDEVDDVDGKGYKTLRSRTGRRNESGAPRVTVSACNPNDGWTRQEVYLPWLKRNNDRREGISDEEWEQAEPLPESKMVIEFTMEDSPLLLDGYYDRYDDYPQDWKERFLLNNWFFVDDTNALFKRRAMDSLTIARLKRGHKYISVDPNAGGKDRACIMLWEGDTIVDAKVYTTKMLEELAEEDEKKPVYNYGAIIGRLTIELAIAERVSSMDIVGDVVGIGQGWLTYMLGHGYGHVAQFRAGDAPLQKPEEKEKGIKPPYFDLRSQMYYLWAMDVQNAKVFLYSGMPFLTVLKRELQLHQADSTSKVIRVTPKDQIRALLGGSPDMADAGMMGYWLRLIRTKKAASASETASVGRSFEDMYNEANGF